MIVGFIGFGQVSSTLSNILSSNGIQTVTVVKDRSQKTNKLAVKSDVRIIDSYEALLLGSDIVISANSPANALNIADKYADYMGDGIYVDLNNISPNTTYYMADLFEKPRRIVPQEESSRLNFFKKKNDVDIRNNFVDGAIIGNVSNKPPLIILSGVRANELAILNNYGLNVKVLSKIPGDVATLKILRSLYTKGVSAVLMEAFETAKEMDLEEQLFEILSITEGENFEEKSKSRLKNTYANSKRKVEEMDEALEFLDEVSKGKKHIMTKATKDKFDSY
ncbi:DUF1932 domain-containing protein [uncultured Methanobrevibacter sp.]|uniref:DUF1932 domain-containing protein n=1 Tax=uncultured Methanobrevibacter sp. TaxID=253161 RepID=UPI0025D9F92B|nr:DUF1932 domain-containing protein [uncultured Methanobrevibacter sp.]